MKYFLAGFAIVSLLTIQVRLFDIERDLDQCVVRR